MTNRRKVYDEETGDYRNPAAGDRREAESSLPRPCHVCGCRHWERLDRIFGGAKARKCRHCGQIAYF